ncbi:MAG: nodulation protein NfeD [Dehalococcoidia bacterium]|nr:nodulation protein NfeD [Dehalococcoidia bacterium]
MVRRTLLAVVVILVASSFAVSELQGQGGGGVLVGRLDSQIDPVSARVVRGWIEDAEARSARLLVLEIDTPGGRLDSMRDMTGALLDSTVPVAVIVTPAGARAASAGTFIVASGHVAAMTPGTTIGAASPVDAGGNDLRETIKAKASQDAAALLRGIAAQRGRNSEALEKTIFEASSYSAEEALELGVVDLNVRDVSDLIAKLDGTEIEVQGTTVTLATSQASVELLEATPVQRFQGWLANPHLVFILFAVGGILIIVELVSPGGWIPGAVGLGLLLLAFVGIGNLPVNWIGLALMGGGLVLLFVELQAPGWGGFGAAGGIAFVIGGFLLFGDTSVPGLPAPDMRVGWAVLAGTAVFIAISVFGLFHFSRKAQDITVVSRASQIIGQTGVVRSTLDPIGTVHLAGELWTAESESGDTIESGETVVAAELDGVKLRVVRESSLGAI